VGAFLRHLQRRAGSVEQRLAVSGIGWSELHEPLDALQSNGPEFDRYMSYLRTFASLVPGQRLVPPFAFVCGNNGVGKSAGAQRALRDAIRNGSQGRFLRLSQLLDAIYATYGGGDETTDDRMRFYASVHLLVIDEVGGETSSDHAMNRFFDLVDDRYKNRLPTIFTSNYLPQEDSLGAHISERTGDPTRMKGIMDRIRGGVGTNLFVIRGKSWRGVA
jgi:DNA replication protein DnaC